MKKLCANKTKSCQVTTFRISCDLPQNIKINVILDLFTSVNIDTILVFFLCSKRCNTLTIPEALASLRSIQLCVASFV